MDFPSSKFWSRCKFPENLTAAGTVGLTDFRPGTAVAEPPPETPPISIVYGPGAPIPCYHLRYVATEPLRIDYPRDLQAFREVPYAQWREYDPEDTLPFYTLRMHKPGFIETSPEVLVARASNWRFLNELKPELKT